MSRPLLTIFLPLLLLLQLNAFAGVEPYKNFIKGAIKAGDSLMIKDEKFRNPAFNWSEITNISVSNSISLQVIDEQPISSSFSCTLRFRLEYFTSPEQQLPTKIDSASLHVNYDKHSGASYKGIDIFNFQNGYYVKLYVLSVNSPEFGANMPPYLQLMSLINIDRTYLFKPHLFLGLNGEMGNAEKSSSLRQISGGAKQNHNTQLALTWGNEDNPDEYDLEWTTVDAGSDWVAMAQNLLAHNDIYSAEDKNNAFRNNATRVTTAEHEYTISLIYDSPYLMVRIRPVSYLADGTRNEGPWYYQQQNQSDYSVWEIDVHQSGLNWQYSAAFAEQGKKKEVVSYFDGSLRSRQTVTVANSYQAADNVAVVQENIYDEFGRASASILPAPEKRDTTTNYLHYFPAFNRNTANTPYSYADLNASACELIASPLSTDFGASRYYSPNNPFRQLKSYNNYIPDAQQKPISITRYTPDNTGRIREQGSVGPTFQTSLSGHTTKYYYSKPDQWELDRLFGNDVGYAEHYLKNMVVDPNGQVSISYINASGKTIATALTGPTPESVSALSGKPPVRTDTTALFKADQFTFNGTTLSLTATATKTISVPGPITILYNIEKLISLYPGGDFKACSNCYYNLKISIRDECDVNTPLREEIVSIGSKTRDVHGGGQYTGTPINLNLSRIGEYYITFEFALDKNVIEHFAAEYIRLGQDSLKIRKQYQYVLDELKRTDLIDCFSDCKTARAKLGAKPAFLSMFRSKIAALGEKPENLDFYNSDISDFYDHLLPRIDSLEQTCVTSVVPPCSAYKQLMLMDVSPGGQYASIDNAGNLTEPSINVLSLHFRTIFPVLSSTHTLYLANQVTKADGSVTSPYASDFSVTDMVKYWQAEWAENFLIYHPEYCKLQFCEQNSVSGAWDESLRNIEKADAQAVVSNQAYNRNNPGWLLAGDPFFATGGLGYQYYNNMLADLNQYSSRILHQNGLSVKSISQMVDYQLYCATTNATTNLNNVANDWNACSPVEDCRIADREWQAYRDMYLDVKNIYFELLRSATCGADCVTATTISATSSSCSSLALNYTAVSLSANQFREFNYPLNQQTTYTMVTGTVGSPPNVYNYCSNNNNPAVFYPCLTLTMDGSAFPSQFTDVWVVKCLENISSGCQGLSYDINAAYQNSGNVFVVSNGSYQDIYTVYQGYTSQSGPSAYCANGSAADLTYIDCLTVHMSGGLVQEFTGVWLAICYGGSGGPNPGGGGDPCGGPVAYNNLQANLVNPCEEYPTASKKSQAKTQSKGSQNEVVSYVADFNTRNIYRIANVEMVNEDNSKLPAERFGIAVFRERFVVESRRKAFATYRQVWVSEFLPDSSSVNGKRNQHFDAILSGLQGQSGKLSSRSASSVTTNNTTSGPCVLVSDTETSNVQSSCNPNGLDRTNTSYLIMTDGGYAGVPAPNDITVRFRYTFNPAVGAGGTPVTLYEDVTIPAGQTYAEFNYLSSHYAPIDGLNGCYLQERTFECIVSITGGSLCYESLCNNTANCSTAYQGKVSRFFNVSGDLVTPVGNASSVEAQNLSDLGSLISGACEANAQEAIRQLGLENNSNYTSAQINLLKEKLTALCTLGGSVDRPFGASTIPVPDPGNMNVSNTVYVNGTPCWTFEAIIKAALSSGGQIDFTDTLNPWLINSPYPHSPKAQQTERIIGNTSEDICNRLASFNTGGWNADQLYVQLKAQFGNAMTLNAEGLRVLMKGCGQCRYLLSANIALPVFLDGQSTGCISYAQYSAAMSTLQGKFNQPLNPVNFSNYERIVTNYLNFTFGFSLSYAKYAAFTSGTLCNEVAFDGYEEDPMACVKSKIEVAYGIADNAYLGYIQALEDDFRTSYINTCAAAKAAVQTVGTDDVYHYTLYYYDQAGNLIRTVPPEGVTLLSKNEMRIVSRSREQKEADYCSFLGPDMNSDEGVAFLQMSNTIAAQGGCALEFWMYSPNVGNRQFMATTPDMKYMVQACMADNRVNVDIYTIVQNSATSVSIILSNHVTADVSSIGPLPAWAHLVVQGASLSSGPLEIYVNGKSFAPVAGAPSAGCGWSMSGPSDMPRNLSTLKHLRTYTGRLMSPSEIKTNAESGCFAAQNPANMAWFRFNTPSPGTLTTIADHGSEETPYAGYYPAHRLTTSYVYNSHNQIVKQQTPDAGLSVFWYDKLGKLVISQNAKQKLAGTYSYTKYDSLDRIKEVGLKTLSVTLPEPGFISKVTYDNFIAQGNNSEITETYYDGYPSGSGIQTVSQVNLNKRVAASVYRESAGSSNINATYYSYDIGGNVKTLYQQINGLGTKRIDYEYDLVSGKVNFVAYQKSAADKFFYEYKYDAENRLISAWTSTVASLKSYGFGSKLLEPYKSLDAKYEYYLHGPLARVELGREGAKVQGSDYAYTLQGWLKGINGSSLSPSTEIGNDNFSGLNAPFLKDALGYSLGYYNGDYQPIGGGNAFSAYQSNGTDESGRSLFNGNISNAIYAISKIAGSAPTGYTYAYDQLNRIKLVRQQKNISPNGWSFNGSNDEFKETFGYDGNGNIEKLIRNNSSGSVMDNLTYNYNRDGAGRLVNNRLSGINDTAGGTASVDVNSTSYGYDAIGNLLTDQTEGLSSIDWNVYGKIKKITKPNTGDISYTYDASGNRVSKTTSTKTDWYVRDAQGNVLGEYSTPVSGETAGVRWREQHLYGSSRLGMWKPNINLATASGSQGEQDFGMYGNKFFELNNHLGNTMVVISDVRDPGDWSSPTVINSNDYYAFGGQMQGRAYTNPSASTYRYGFNGKENDNEVKGEGNQQDYGMRIYDPRIGKFLSVDPITAEYPALTPYQFASNRPIDGIDLDGLEYYKLDLSITNGKTKLTGTKVRDFEIFGWKYSDDLLIDVKYKGNNFRFEKYTGGPYKGGLPYNDFGDFNNFIKDPEGYRKNVVSDVEWGGAVLDGYVASELAFPSSMQLPSERKPVLPLHKNSNDAEGDFMLYDVHSEPNKQGELLKVGKADAERIRANGDPVRMKQSEKAARKAGYPNATATPRKPLGKTTTGAAKAAEAAAVKSERAKGNTLPLNKERDKKYKQ